MYDYQPPSPSVVHRNSSAQLSLMGANNANSASANNNISTNNGSSGYSFPGASDNIRVCARFRPLNRVEEALNAHMASTGLRENSFNCVRFPSETRDRVEIKVPDALMLAVERHEQSGKSDEGFISDLVASFGNGLGNPMASRTESFVARSPSTSSMAPAAWGNQSGGMIFGASPSNVNNISTHSTPSMSLAVGSSLQSLANNPNALMTTTSHAFTYDRVFDQHVSQEAVYNEVGAPIVTDVMQGYNGTIFVYGQTGSGKTHTMMGAAMPNAPLLGDRGRQGSVVSASAGTPRRGTSGQNAAPFSPGGYQNPRTQVHSSSHALQSPPQFDLLSPEGSGIIPRAVNHLFECMYASPDTVSFTVSLFFVEIYMEKVRDLLVPDPSQSNLNIREDPKSSSFYIEGCVMADVTAPQDIFQLLNYGIQNRATASTRMNVMSSRSHCLLCIAVHAFDSELSEQRIGKLFLVDLAGSEKVAKTRAEGQQLEEAKVINKSLTALGHVINQLSNHAPHIPYRDSKLTKILQDALGGNSRTALIVCCSPSIRNIHETLSTLRFGQRAKTIKNRAVINKQFTLEELKVMLEAAKMEIDTLRRTNSNMVVPRGPSNEALISNHAVQEARFADEKKTLIANIHALEDALRDANEAVDEEVEARRGVDATVAKLREEIRVWESEYNSVSAECQGLRTNQGDSRTQLANERDAMAQLLQAYGERKDEVARLRELAQRAMGQFQSELDASSSANTKLQEDVSRLTLKNRKLSEQNATLLQERTRLQAEVTKLREGERLATEQRAAAERNRAAAAFSVADEILTSQGMSSVTNSTPHSPDVNGLVADTEAPTTGSISAYEAEVLNLQRFHSVVSNAQLKTATDRADAALTRLEASEKLCNEMENSIEALLHENTTLTLDLTRANQKLELLECQCSGYERFFEEHKVTFAAIQEDNKRAVNDLKVRLLQARGDAADWRKRYDKLLQGMAANSNTNACSNNDNPLTASMFGDVGASTTGLLFSTRGGGNATATTAVGGGSLSPVFAKKGNSRSVGNDEGLPNTNNGTVSSLTAVSGLLASRPSSGYEAAFATSLEQYSRSPSANPIGGLGSGTRGNGQLRGRKQPSPTASAPADASEGRSVPAVPQLSLEQLEQMRASSPGTMGAPPTHLHLTVGSQHVGNIIAANAPLHGSIRGRGHAGAGGTATHLFGSTTTGAAGQTSVVAEQPIGTSLSPPLKRKPLAFGASSSIFANRKAAPHGYSPSGSNDYGEEAAAAAAEGEGDDGSASGRAAPNTADAHRGGSLGIVHVSSPRDPLLAYPLPSQIFAPSAGRHPPNTSHSDSHEHTYGSVFVTEGSVGSSNTNRRGMVKYAETEHDDDRDDDDEHTDGHPSSGAGGGYEEYPEMASPALTAASPTDATADGPAAGSAAHSSPRDASNGGGGGTAIPSSDQQPHYTTSPSPRRSSGTGAHLSVPVIRGGSGGERTLGTVSPSPSPSAPDRVATGTGYAAVAHQHQLTAGGNAMADSDPLGDTSASPILGGTAMLGSSTMRVGAGGFGAPSHYDLLPTAAGGSVVVVRGEGSLQNTALFGTVGTSNQLAGSIRGRQHSAGASITHRGGGGAGAASGSTADHFATSHSDPTANTTTANNDAGSPVVGDRNAHHSQSQSVTARQSGSAKYFSCSSSPRGDASGYQGSPANAMGGGGDGVGDADEVEGGTLRAATISANRQPSPVFGSASGSPSGTQPRRESVVRITTFDDFVHSDGSES